jgi:hypothetical protein
MTSRGGWRPRTGLAVALAAAAIVAVGLQASALAGGTDKEKKTAEEKKPAREHAGATTTATAPKPATTPVTQTQTQKPVTRQIGSVTVTVDPATGRLRPPTPEEAAQLASILGTMTSREVSQVPVVAQPDGAQMAILGEGFEEVAMASKDGKKTSLYCVNTRGQAEKILAGGVVGGPDYNARPKAADRKADKGAKGGSGSAEKE